MYKINIFDKLHNKKQHIVFNGPDGLLEGITYNMNNIKGENLALILPPDPNYKGTMNNKIVNSLFDEFQKLGFSTLKINYRGIGLSKGSINQKEDLIIDALHALDFLIKKCETHKVKSPKIFIAGFSLGGWVALQCAMRRPEISGFITINTKFSPNDFNMLTPCPNGLILQATYDALTNPAHAEKFASQLINQKECAIKFKTLNDDHYLTYSSGLLQEIIPEYIKELKTRQILKK